MLDNYFHNCVLSIILITREHQKQGIGSQQEALGINNAKRKLADTCLVCFLPLEPLTNFACVCHTGSEHERGAVVLFLFLFLYWFVGFC